MNQTDRDRFFAFLDGSRYVSPVELEIARADFGDPRLEAFLRAHLAAMAPTAPEESRHSLDLDELAMDGVRLWVGLCGHELVVTGATVAVGPGHEEIKSMCTAPQRRGQGLARKMMDHLMVEARSRGVRRLSLETGSMDFFRPAHALYRSVGFQDCPPFGKYRPDPNSLWFSREL